MAESKPRVLLVTRNFPPLWGGMERLNWHLVDELRREFELRLVAPAGARANAPPGIDVVEVPLRPLARFLVAAAWAASREARRWRPHWVLAGSGLTAPLAWLVARLCGARSAVYLHGLDVALRHPLYRGLWLPAMRRMDLVIANSHATAGLARAAGIAPERLRVVHPGVQIPDFDPQAAERFRTAHGLPAQARVLLSVGRLTERKGLRQFVRDVLPRIVAAEPQALLVVVGDAPADSLHARTQAPQDIEAEARRAGVARHLRFVGKRFGRELADAYFGADLHVFPVRELPGDPEGFGMVAVEAAAHGLWTVAYATGGVVDAVDPDRSGLLVAAGDAAGFADAVLAGLREPRRDAEAVEWARGFSWESIGSSLRQLMHEAPPARS